MLSIYQIKEGINILNDIDAKSYRTELRYYTLQYSKTKYGLDIYDGYGNIVSFIPVMMPASAVRISPSVMDIHVNDTESTAINETSTLARSPMETASASTAVSTDVTGCALRIVLF